MKVIVIGDIHGRDTWKKIISENKDADRIVFMGDYFDSFDIPWQVQIQNFEEILRAGYSNQNIVLLLGNHDYQYLNDVQDRYSGYNAELHEALRKSGLLEMAVLTSRIQMCYIMNRVIYTHAGVTKSFVERFNLDLESLAASLNKNLLFNRSIFKFAYGTGDNYGEHPLNSPIWVRPNSLASDLADDRLQVVGHTKQKEIDTYKKIIVVDTLGTSGEYLEIENGNILTVKKI